MKMPDRFERSRIYRFFLPTFNYRNHENENIHHHHRYNAINKRIRPIKSYYSFHQSVWQLLDVQKTHRNGHGSQWNKKS